MKKKSCMSVTKDTQSTNYKCTNNKHHIWIINMNVTNTFKMLKKGL